MHFLIYVSAARHLMSDDELSAVLDTSRRHNASDGITGMLLYKDGSFMQLLEGEKTIVEATYNRISRDSRHHGLITLRQSDTEERSFADWSMAFRSVNASDLESVPGFTDLGDETFTSPAFTDHANRALTALRTFHQTTG